MEQISIFPFEDKKETYYPDGSLKTESYYQDGVLVYEVEWYESGQKKAWEVYKDGTIQKSAVYTEDLPDQALITIYENGKPSYTDVYF